MTLRRSALILAAAATILWHTSTSLDAQTALGGGQAASAATSRIAKPYGPPRTPDGRPDLQGTWNVATLTPLERPEALKDRVSLTDEEAARIAKTEQGVRELRSRTSRADRDAPPQGGDGSTGAAGGVGGYNYFWIDRGSSALKIDGQWRSSLIVDPLDGRVPPMLPEARERNATINAPTSDQPENDPNAHFSPWMYEDHEKHPLAERCILGFGSTSGPPVLPNYFYNNLKQIVQTRDTILIFIEMVHDARIVRMNQPHLPSHIRKWMGDSIGRWDGDTLVIETTNFTDKTRFRGSSDNLKVTEYIRRIDNDTLLYRFTIDDPSTWSRPWTGEYPWVRTDELIYEYACHEGNYSFGGILRGARLLEKEATEAAEAKKK